MIDKTGQVTLDPACALICSNAQAKRCAATATSLTCAVMRNIEAFAAEVREDIGLSGPIEAKVLAVWAGLRLYPMPCPCDGLVKDNWVTTAAYYAMAGESCSERQIAHAACAHLLMEAGCEFPRWWQVDLLAASLCGGPILAAVAV